MLLYGRVGPQLIADGTANELRLTRDSSVATQDTHGRFQEAIYRGNVYVVSSAAVATPTGAVPLGAAGTPLAAIYNPPGSGKIAVVLQTNVTVRNVGTTLGLGSFWFSGGPTVAITAAVSAYLNLLSLQGTGSSMKPYGSTALTGSTAASSIRPIWGTGYSATQATAVAPNGYTEDTAGSIFVIPGNFVAVSCSVTGGTGSTVDTALVWEEILL